MEKHLVQGLIVKMNEPELAVFTDEGELPSRIWEKGRSSERTLEDTFRYLAREVMNIALSIDLRLSAEQGVTIYKAVDYGHQDLNEGFVYQPINGLLLPSLIKRY